VTRPLHLALIGIGGYGNHYVTALLDAPPEAGVRIVSAVDPAPQACRRLAELADRGVPVLPGIEALGGAADIDLAVISTPIHLHAPHTCWALQRGAHVLCEKPLCATLDEINRMVAARNRADRQVAIGYQWSFSDAIQRLKADILAGRFGRPRRLRSITLWPRGSAYYSRNAWAGMQRDPGGRWVLDSPVNNACAHHLHNMLYVLGPERTLSATPMQVTAELYRANPIENYDSAALRVLTADGAELLFYVAHAVAQERGPEFVYEFERATVTYSQLDGATLRATLTDGTQIDYGQPDDGRQRKLWAVIDAIRNGTPVPCGIEAASAHTRCVWAACASQPAITDFPEPLIRICHQPQNQIQWVEGLAETLGQCYDAGCLPSELGIAWAKPGMPISV